MKAKQAVKTARKQAVVQAAPVRQAEAVRQRTRAEEERETASNHLMLALQAKLRIAPPNDPLEREADRVAASISRGPRTVQRKCSCGGTCDQCRKVQRHGTSDVRRLAVPSAVERVVASSGQALDAATRGFMEPRFGRDFSDVRIHLDERAAASARAIEARAYTVGRHIAFDRGEYSPVTDSGRRLLAHELTHVVQQDGVAGDTAFRDDKDKKSAAASGLAHPEAFFEWWKKVAGFEGSLADWHANIKFNKDDKGGQTQYGVTRDTFRQFHGAAGLPNTDEAFAAMTPEQAMGIGKSFWKNSHADELQNAGVAIIVCDWYWGSTLFAFDRIKARLSAMGYHPDTSTRDLDPQTIAIMDGIDPAKLQENLTNARLRHYYDIAKADPTQEKFLKGWSDRAMDRYRQAQASAGEKPVIHQHAWDIEAVREAASGGQPGRAARLLNGKDFTDAEVEHELSLMLPSQIAEVYEAAARIDDIGENSRIAKATRYRRLVYRFQFYLSARNYSEAAFYLNYFSEQDIKDFATPLRKKHPDQLKLLHEAAVETKGAGSYAALFTAP